MLIYEKPNHIQVVYYPNENFILFDWTNFRVTLAEIRELHEKALATAQEKGCYYYIAETSKVRNILPGDVIRWWGEVWVPKLVAAGLRAIVTVVPSSTSTLATLSTHDWQVVVVGGITMKNVKSFSAAKALIKTLQ
jgi:hypothetical protein